MKKILVKFCLVAAMGLMFVIQVNAQSSQDRIPFSTTVDFCGELVDVDGEFHFVSNSVFSNNGNVMLKYHVNGKGTGVGQDSGAVYQWNEVSNQTFNASKGINYTVTQTFMMIGQGKAPNRKVHLTYHITINANGELTVDVYNLSVECK
ncbi:hypothetical protein [Aquiflexum sp.]|uniref:hypothetical protein n=1 Tax=Aquiflexum sp. TaxID=1872584 RepID=UPI003594462E